MTSSAITIPIINQRPGSVSATRTHILYLASFVLYVILSTFAIAHHEVWSDEVHSWNIAKASVSYADLIANTRYEGHPPGWYTILWIISKFTHDLVYMKAAQWAIACATAFLIFFRSPFPPLTRLLIPFGYYFLFEYGVISRNYAAGVFLVCCICIVLRKDLPYRLPLYYLLLFALSNIHLLALLLAASLHLYFLLQLLEQRQKKTRLLLHFLLGGIILLPSLHFIFPPSDSQLNTGFWQHLWTYHQLTDPVNIPIRCFIPIPAFWNYHFWNTQFLLELKDRYPFVRWAIPFLSLSLLVSVFLVLKGNRKCLSVFFVNFFLGCALSAIAFALTTARYAGFVYIGFIAAYWLYCAETPVTRIHNRIVNFLLSIQLIGGLYAVAMDAFYPFSNLYQVNRLIKEVPAGTHPVTDYWTMNAMVAFTDKPAYCIDMQKELSFVLWASDLATIRNNPFRYTTGLRNLFKKEGAGKEGATPIYMISTGTLTALHSTDRQLTDSFRIDLIGKQEGAIEKGSNLYLYRINRLHNQPIFSQ